MKIRSTPIRYSLLVFAAAAATASLAAGGGGGGGGGGGMTTLATKAPVRDAQYDRAVDEISAGHYTQAITLLESWVGAEPSRAADADAQNWLGYAYRKSGNLDAAFLHYDKALAIDPRHRGAHEYLGEAYLMAGNLPRAEEHLKILDKLCWTPCSEYTQLKTAVAAYRTAHAESLGSR